MKTFSTKDNIPQPMLKCLQCVNRKKHCKDEPCWSCIFYGNFPNFKEDFRIVNSKLDEFTAEKYKEYCDKNGNTV